MIEKRIVEAACGECQFTMPGKGCDLAVRMDGECYFVDGVGIDDHGDAHAHDGLCNAVRQARVSAVLLPSPAAVSDDTGSLRAVQLQ